MTPYREFRPYHGLNPTIPHILAGWRIEPPVSVQRAAGTSPAATAAAEPDDEPPGIRVISHGFLAGPNPLFSPLHPMANSSIFVFQKEMNPACFILSVTVDSYGGIKSLSIFELAVVRIQTSQKISFTAIGSPFFCPSGRVLNA